MATYGPMMTYAETEEEFEESCHHKPEPGEFRPGIWVSHDDGKTWVHGAAPGVSMDLMIGAEKAKFALRRRVAC